MTAVKSAETAAMERSDSGPRPPAMEPRAGGIASGRLPWLALGFAALLAGIWAGLIRAGWALPAPSAALAAMHGPLVACGFLGTLIGLERAVALGRPWAWAAPVLAGAGGLAILAGFPLPIALPGTDGASVPAGAVLMVASSAVFLASSLAIFQKQPAPFTGVMLLGAACWLAGNASWVHGLRMSVVVLWWAAFLILTIAGERLEMSRVAGPGDRAGIRRFLAASGLLVSGPAWATFEATAVAALTGAAALGPTGGPALGGVADAIVQLTGQASADSAWIGGGLDTGYRLAGAGMIGLVLWLARHDAALRTVRLPGLPRFVAVNILAGYAWLLGAGCLAVAAGDLLPGLSYDAFVHLVFLGFIFGMVFGHAPIILPAVLRVPLAFRPLFWAHFALLEASLALRVAADAAGWFDGRKMGALLNAAAILLFLASTAFAISQAIPARQAGSRTAS